MRPLPEPRPHATSRHRRSVTGRSTTRPCIYSTHGPTPLATLLAREFEDPLDLDCEVAELGHRVDETEQLDDAVDAVDPAHRLPDRPATNRISPTATAPT